ncbi:hypothetical protein CEXT_132601 [Caerostris extrusa]|uniref:Uncharacterized protein n=1 Tax=Caerostris extrusa TaxID=172846 RepID=A0AAV4U8H6_CAEEX|nr:hypothetical protein CEXT_132601 [Caerostris extrusa]
MLKREQTDSVRDPLRPSVGSMSSSNRKTRQRPIIQLKGSPNPPQRISISTNGTNKESVDKNPDQIALAS